MTLSLKKHEVGDRATVNPKALKKPVMTAGGAAQRTPAVTTAAASTNSVGSRLLPPVAECLRRVVKLLSG